MVRINLLSPKSLTDQHLIAEYNEILMLLGYVKKYPLIKCGPPNYCLGSGHILFFKNKLIYLEKRFKRLRLEMIMRGFRPKKKVNLTPFPKILQKDWKPQERDLKIIRKRLICKVSSKPKAYTYYRKYQPKEILIKLIKK